MKNAMKKLLSLMLVAVLLVSAVPFKASAESNPTEPATVADDATEPAATEPTATEPTATEPAATEPAATEPAPTEPAATTPAPTEPAATTPAPTEPAATTPAPTEPAATTPAPTEPADDNADLIVGNGDKKILLTLDMNYEGSKDRYVRVTDPNTKMGVIMEAIQKNNLIPTRANYTFAGWYWDDDFDYKVKDNEYLTDSTTTAVRIYAKWTRNSSAYNVFLKIYVNGTTSSPAKIVDISSYGDADGTIDIYEARKVVGSYYTAKDSAGLSYDGLFTDETWKRGAYNDSDEVNSVPVNTDDDTFIYIMVYNAKTASSSSSSSSSSTGTADTTNPKTSDSVYMVMTVMGLSAAALAAVYYVSKKRAF